MQTEQGIVNFQNNDHQKVVTPRKKRMTTEWKVVELDAKIEFQP